MHPSPRPLRTFAPQVGGHFPKPALWLPTFVGKLNGESFCHSHRPRLGLVRKSVGSDEMCYVLDQFMKSTEPKYGCTIMGLNPSAESKMVLP